MSKLNFDTYIEIIDRLLERKGLTTAEREEIFNYPENIELISSSFKKYISPRYIINKINTEHVRELYTSTNESFIDNWEKKNELEFQKEIIINGDEISGYCEWENKVITFGITEDCNVLEDANINWYSLSEDQKQELSEIILQNIEFVKDNNELSFNDGYLDMIDELQSMFNNTIYESRKKPITKKDKDNKFKKVMKEFGKGKLKPFHSKKNLKSKKQRGSKKERAQALAIAFSESNLKKESFEPIVKFVSDYLKN